MNKQVPEISDRIASEEDIKKVMAYFKKEEWQKLRIWEFVVVDVDAELARFKAALSGGAALPTGPAVPFEELCRSLQAAVSNRSHARLCSTIDIAAAQRLFAVHRGSETSSPELCAAHYERALRLVNLWFYQRLDAQLEQIITNVSNRIRCVCAANACIYTFKV